MKDKKWIYYNPSFESEQYNPMMLVYSPWTGHKRFAYDFVRFMEPQVIVELGSYYGCSAFSFLQAIKDGGLKSSFYGVDTWAGDDYTQNDYKEDIYGAYKAINDKCFSEVNSVMLRMTFDEACPEFEEKSIDLLHIDGSHSYEDVKHDWLTWKDKVKDNGVVFFHDVGEDLLFGEKMGSHIFWEELKAEMPFTLEFGFSNGLGILFKDEYEYQLIKNAMSMDTYQGYINIQDTINKDELRKGFFRQRDLEKYNADLKAQVDSLKDHLDKYEADTNAKQSYIAHLEEQKEQLKQDSDKAVDELKAYSEGKAAYAAELELQINELKIFADEKDKYAAELEKEKEALISFSKEKEAYAEGLLTETEKLKTFAAEKDKYAADLEKQLADLRKYADDKASYANDLEKQTEELKAYANGKAFYAEELEKQLADLNAFASGKDKYASDLEERLAALNKVFEERENSFNILQQYASDTEKNLNHEINKLLSEIEDMKKAQASLCEEKAMVEKNLEQLKERLKRLPFGSKLLKGIE